MVASASAATPPDRTVAAQILAWQALLRGVTQSGQMSEGRFDSYCRGIVIFEEWIGKETAIDQIDEARLERYFTHLSVQVGAGKYSPSYAHMLLVTARQFITRLVEMKLIALPGNIRSRRFRFNHSAPSKIELFSTAEVRQMLAVCEAFSPKTKLYLLLMLNCGTYQNDIAVLLKEEVNWRDGTLTRARSKTRERGGPMVTYKLWPETFTLLKKFKAETGELALTTDEGKPLVRLWLEEGKMRRNDVIQSAWSRLAEKLGLKKIRLGMKHLRKMAASLLGEHPQYKFYANHFLADSPKGMADKHYVKPNDEEFFAALEWLRGQLLAPFELSGKAAETKTSQPSG